MAGKFRCAQCEYTGKPSIVGTSRLVMFLLGLLGILIMIIFFIIAIYWLTLELDLSDWSAKLSILETIAIFLMLALVLALVLRLPRTNICPRCGWCEPKPNPQERTDN